MVIESYGIISVMKIKNYFNVLIKIIYSLFFIFTVILNMFSKDFIYANKSNIVQNNYLYLILGILYFIFIFIISIFISKKIKFKIVKISLLLLFLIVSIISGIGYFFPNNHDPFVIQRGADLIANNLTIIHEEYYSFWPNNLSLLSLTTLIFTIIKNIGLYEYRHLILVSINCIFLMLSIILIDRVLMKLKIEESFRIFSLLLTTSLFILLPWRIVFYNDIIAMLLVLILINLFLSYIVKFDNKFLIIAFFLIPFFVKMKAHIGIVAIAMSIILVIYYREKFDLKKIVLVAIAFVLGTIINTKLIEIVPVNVDKERNFSITHYLMMGLNDKSMGIYSIEDTNMTILTLSKEERVNMNLSVAYERVKRLGVSGLLDLYVKKNFSNYNDGMFSWEFDTNVHAENINTNDNFIQKLSKNIYYPKGVYYFYYESIIQSIWLSILLFNGLSFNKSNDIENEEEMSLLFMKLIILGISLYLILFECRARYLMQFIPIFCILSVISLRNIIQNNKFFKNI